MERETINNIKSLGIDMINEAGSGHPGIVLGAAPIIYTLYANHMNVSMSDPNWVNRDRFIMSAGHGSALLYATLYMAGYDLTLTDLKDFRRIMSKTPGHPEVGVTPGVDMSTGPLGQGVASAVGMAIAEKMAEAKYKIPKKMTEIHLLDAAFAFDDVLDIVKDKSKIEMYLWSEEHYLLLNVIYKVCKNSEKLIKALDKHKSKLIKIADEYIEKKSNHFIEDVSSKAFGTIRKYYNNEIPADMIVENIEQSIMIQRMLGKAKEIFDNELVVEQYTDNGDIAVSIYSYAVYDYLESILQSQDYGYVLNSKVLCAADYGAPQKRMRFIIVGVKKSISKRIALPNGSFDEDQYRTVRDAIEDLEMVEPVYSPAEDKGTKLPVLNNMKELGRQLRDADVLKNHIITKTTDTAMERFKALEQGQNFHCLKESLKTNTYTDAKRTQNTIYLRLNYEEQCGYILR